MVSKPEGEQKTTAGKWKRILKVERGKPPFTIIFIVVIIAAILAFLGIYRIIGSEHEIKVIIDCEDPWGAEIYIRGSYEYTSGIGQRELIYNVREGQSIEVYASKNSDRLVPLTVTIYDDGKKVREQSTTRDYGDIILEYTV